MASFDFDTVIGTGEVTHSTEERENQISLFISQQGFTHQLSKTWDNEPGLRIDSHF